MCVFLSLSFSLRSPLSESESIRSLKKKKEKRKKRKERKGKERKGKERKGKERKGKERKGKERNKEKAPSPSRTLLDISQKMSPAAGFSASSPWGVLCASWAGVFISFAGSGNFFFPISSSFSSASGTPCEANVGTRQEVPEASHVVLGFVSIFLGGGEDRLPFPSFPIDGSLVASPPAESPIRYSASSALLWITCALLSISVSARSLRFRADLSHALEVLPRSPEHLHNRLTDRCWLISVLCRSLAGVWICSFIWAPSLFCRPRPLPLPLPLPLALALALLLVLAASPCVFLRMG